MDPATLAALPLEFIAGEQQAELMAAIKVLGDDGEFPEARVQELTQAHERAALPERDMLLKYKISELHIIGCVGSRAAALSESPPTCLVPGVPPRNAHPCATYADPHAQNRPFREDPSRRRC